MPFEFDATGGLEDWDGFDESGGFVFNEPLREEAEDQPARGAKSKSPCRSRRCPTRSCRHAPPIRYGLRLVLQTLTSACRLLADPRALGLLTWRWCHGFRTLARCPSRRASR
jgi:hypothetical protein